MSTRQHVVLEAPVFVDHVPRFFLRQGSFCKHSVNHDRSMLTLTSPPLIMRTSAKHLQREICVSSMFVSCSLYIQHRSPKSQRETRTPVVAPYFVERQENRSTKLSARPSRSTPPAKPYAIDDASQHMTSKQNR